MSRVYVPEDFTSEQVTAALRALGLDHLENDTEQGLMLRSVHIDPRGSKSS